MKEKTTNKKVEKALIKKALGYDAVEIVEEYVNNEGEIVLLKKKVTTKNVPPDVSALKLVLDSGKGDVKGMTDSELEDEKNRLLLTLAKMQNYDKENNSATKKEKTP